MIMSKTQLELDDDASDRLKRAEQRLRSLVAGLQTRVPDPNVFRETQRLWEAFADYQARERAGLFDKLPGSIAGLRYVEEKVALTSWRIDDLEKYRTELEDQ